MDTSIVILIIIGVLVFALPSLAKGAAKTGDADTVPPSARDPRTGSRTHCDGQASQPNILLQGAIADIPETGVPLAAQPPNISLRRPEPHLTVVSGGQDTAELAQEDTHDHIYLAPASGMETVAVSHRPLDIRMTAHTPKNHAPQNHTRKTTPPTAATQARMAHIRATGGSTRGAGNAGGKTTSAANTGGRTPGKSAATTSVAKPATPAQVAPRPGGVSVSAPGQHETNKLKRLLALGFAGLFVAAVVTGAFSIFGPLSFAAPVLTMAASLACLTGVVALNGVNEHGSVEAPREARREAPSEAPRAKQASRAQATVRAQQTQTVRAEKAQPVARTTAPKPRVSEPEAITSEIPVVKEEKDQADVAPAREPEQKLSVTDASEAPELHLGEKFEELSQGKGWFPKDMPVPTYVTKAHAEPATTSGKMEAAQTSYGDSPSDREELARAFAAEVGARPELEDAAKDTAALRHGKAAIRSDKKLANDNARAVVDDVLARRRA
ncbi:hypothetical protein [Brevibacterium paucivorans]|uniref:Uncharacterized protein n=1 Tax=Brevibacterium paucivorans TaxID=170994 RepID=A0A2N6VM00_9MICO|nr:hypothetical protein [Brevibacterium paucivorans]PMD05171.1 hypothetical protein CJ199_08790 [Brevibacterium paucivorans]